MTDDDYVAELRSYGMLSTNQAADRIEALTDALDNLLEAITAEDQFHDRSLTITGSTANLRWLLEAEDDARAALKGETP